jgi:hypothetical protein
MPPRDHANDLLDIQFYTLQEFTGECRSLLKPCKGDNEDDSDARVVEFATSGRHPDHAIQAYVDVLAYMPPNDTEFTLTRDFDSLIYISRTLGHIRRALSVYPIPQFKHTIRQPLHLQYSFHPGATVSSCL